MVEDRGLEPPTCPKSNDTVNGPKASNAGQDSTQPGRHQGVTEGTICKGRTEAGQAGTNPGTPRNTTIAQQEHNASGTGQAMRPELAVIIGAWDDLPEAVRAGILAMVRASGP